MTTPSFTKNNFDVLKQYVDSKLLRQNNQYASKFNTNAISEHTNGAGITINSPLHVLAGLTVSGDETYIQSIDTVVINPDLFINSQYITPGIVKTGIVCVFEPLALTDTCTQLNNNLTITTVGSATFVTNDLISITGTASNNGLYEVDTHIGNILTVRGITGTSTVESFTHETITNETINGVITKVRVSHLSTNSEGGWEYASGSSSGLVYHGVGSDTVTLQNVYDNSHIISINDSGILLKDNATPIAGNLFEIKNNSGTATFLGISSSGAMTTALKLNSNADLTAVNDSSFKIIQSPVATIGEKEFVFNSNTSDNGVVVKIQNKSSSITGHSGIRIQTDTQSLTGLGGNQYISFDARNVGGWTMGRQKSTNTFRWNYLASSSLSLTDDVNTKMFLDTSGNLRAVGSGTFSNIVLQTVPNDNTETNLLTWNAASKTVEYRTVNSLPVVNPFNQVLGTTNDVVFNMITVGGFVKLSASEFLYTFTPTTVTTLGSKQFAFTADSSDNTVLLSIKNKNNGSGTHAALLIQTDAQAATGCGGNQCIHFENAGSGGWTIGHQKSSETFRWNYGMGSEYLTSDLTTKMSLDTNGSLSIGGVLSCVSVNTGQGNHELYYMNQDVGQSNNVVFNQVGINAGHTIISGVIEGYTNIEQFPVSTAVDKHFTFKTNSQSVSYLSIVNKNSTAAAHAGIRIETDAFASGTGGNQFITLVNHTAKPWSIGRKLSDNTIRFNLSSNNSVDPLVNDANTKMSLDAAGKLSMTSLSVNSGNTIISAVNTNTTTFTQNTAVSSGNKQFTFESNTTGKLRLNICNFNSAATAHSSLAIVTDAQAASGAGGNQSIYYHRNGAGGWSVGRQVSTNSFRWNYNNMVDPVDLHSDSDTKMFLDTTGNLNVSNSYKVGGNKVIGSRLAGVADASAASAVILTNSTGGTIDTVIDNVSTVVEGVDGVGNNAASKTDVNARLLAINNNLAELTMNQNAIISDINSIRTAINTLLNRMRSTTGHGLIM